MFCSDLLRRKKLRFLSIVSIVKRIILQYGTAKCDLVDTCILLIHVAVCDVQNVHGKVNKEVTTGQPPLRGANQLSTILFVVLFLTTKSYP